MIKKIDLSIQEQEALILTEANKTLRLDNGEYNEEISQAARFLFLQLIPKLENIDDEYRAYLNISENIEIFIADKKCWVVIKKDNRLRFMTYFEIDDLWKEIKDNRSDFMTYFEN